MIDFLYNFSGILISILFIYILTNIFDKLLGLQYIAVTLRLFKLNNVEIKLLSKALSSRRYKKHIRDIEYMLGIRYIHLRMPHKAIEHLNRAFLNYEKNFIFNKNFELVLDLYIELKKIEEGKKIYLIFKNQISYDKKFIPLIEKYSLIFEGNQIQL
ncbi:hypothetical protein M3685_13030 [Heyndrickxia oleronia]|uniref:hypothetical protein n=1 Tax=Heyndrickxia oleronia TaxID=38875 RepID=UPI0015D159FA|nr:hypothetical protein [Heyndrickxia oleronia]MCM3454844.1 hypothetical protein [Heyndrickxia oleronia]NYV66592.1 hypothetical protein [Bacillus sp. Gen3]GIN41447.1 hypothetical protein J19TS1_43960 [Heyndrickxia oleronia]